jgi:hypothetical protein
VYSLQIEFRYLLSLLTTFPPQAVCEVFCRLRNTLTKRRGDEAIPVWYSACMEQTDRNGQKRPCLKKVINYRTGIIIVRLDVRLDDLDDLILQYIILLDELDDSILVLINNYPTH